MMTIISWIWNICVALFLILVAIILLFIIGDAVYTAYQQYKKYRMTHVRTGPWTACDEKVDLNNECQTIDKIMKKICPAWYENAPKFMRWAIYIDALDLKDGDDNGKKKD